MDLLSYLYIYIDLAIGGKYGYINSILCKIEIERWNLNLLRHK